MPPVASNQNPETSDRTLLPTFAGRTIQPQIVRNPSTFESLTSWSPTLPPSSKATIRKQARRLSEGLNLYAKSSLFEGLQHEALQEGQEALGSGGTALADSWESWEATENEADAWLDDNLLNARGEEDTSKVTWFRTFHDSRWNLTLIGCGNSIQVWDLSDLENLREIALIKDPVGSKQLVVCAAVAPSSVTNDVTLCILSIESTVTPVGNSQLHLYSLSGGSIGKSVIVKGQAVDVKANQRFVIVSCIDPPALHVYDLSTLKPASFSPITSLAPHPFSGRPIFDLGNSRLLAFATTQTLLEEKGANITATGPYATTLAQPSSPASARSVSGENAAHVARKVGKGVLSGVKAIGEFGLAYLSSKSQPAATHAPYSKSAPSPTITQPPPRRQTRPTKFLETPSQIGHVLVVDLMNDYTPTNIRSHSTPIQARTVAHFRPCRHPLALISLNPSSNLLMTSSIEAHSFHIFEIRLGPAQTQYPVWHRYELNRGMTNGRAHKANWSYDSKFIAIGTARGTTHLFALNPMGGEPDLRSHLDIQVVNTESLTPLSVSLPPITRFQPLKRIEAAKHDHTPSAHDSSAEKNLTSSTGIHPICPTIIFLPLLEKFANPECHPSSNRRPSSSRRPATSPHRGPYSSQLKSPSSPIINSKQSLNLLLFHQHLKCFTLEKLETVPHPSQNSPSGTMHVAGLASTALSGLSQLMRSRDQLPPEAQMPVVPTFASHRTYAWQVPPDDGGREMKAATLRPIPETKSSQYGRFSAQAELATFSNSPKVLLRSVYLSPQFQFSTFPSMARRQLTNGDFNLNFKKLIVRREVKSTRPMGVEDEESIRFALDSRLDENSGHLAISPKSPFANAPAFPNGFGKQKAWLDSIPIRSVAPQLNDGLNRVAQEIGRVRGGRSVTSNSEPSVSFDDAETEFQRESHLVPSVESTSATASTPLTSLSEGEDDAWGFDDLHIVPDSPKLSNFKSNENLGATVDDYEDFAVGLLDEQHKERASLTVNSAADETLFQSGNKPLFKPPLASKENLSIRQENSSSDSSTMQENFGKKNVKSRSRRNNRSGTSPSQIV